jgi:hypothetical protein
MFTDVSSKYYETFEDGCSLHRITCGVLIQITPPLWSQTTLQNGYKFSHFEYNTFDEYCKPYTIESTHYYMVTLKTAVGIFSETLAMFCGLKNLEYYITYSNICNAKIFLHTDNHHLFVTIANNRNKINSQTLVIIDEIRAIIKKLRLLGIKITIVNTFSQDDKYMKRTDELSRKPLTTVSDLKLLIV